MIYRALIALWSVVFVSTAGAWTKNGSAYATTGAQADVVAAISNANAGDTITVPAGTFTWGARQSKVILNKRVDLVLLPGATIALAATGPYYASGVINIAADGATISGGTMVGITNTNEGANGSSTTPIACFNSNGWRITGVTYQGPTSPGYFVYTAAANGLIDNCTVKGNSGSLQTFMIRGGPSVWKAPHTMGTANAVYIEDCSISGTSYTNENDGGAQSVIRFNKMSSSAYIDAHMIETATDAANVPHGSRQIEAYDNTFLQAADYYSAFNIAGGTAMLFDNVVANDSANNQTYAIIEEYGAHAGSPTYFNAWATPQIPLVPDQAGTGAYPQTAGAEPVYYFNNRHVDGKNLALTGSAVHANAIKQFGRTFYMTSVEGNPSMLKRGRDYFRGDVGGEFPTTSDVGRGPRAQMLASKPGAPGQAWWVTDEGSWNTTLPANTSGRLYRWNGSAWAVYYEPYTYPHPLRTRGK